MIKREAERLLIILAQQYKAVAVVGPRQSGKTTLVKKIFGHKPYVNFENSDVRLFAIEDPRGFLASYPNGAIFDEAQQVPGIFSYLQQIIDESDQKGMFIITGSNNFLLQDSISQSLAGRIAYLNLLPLTFEEINDSMSSMEQRIWKGSYPSLFNENLDPETWYNNYIRTYLERDVRLIKNINNLHTFERFLRLCAGRIGQLLNMNNLSIEVGVDNKTIASWLSVLESSYVIFRLQPYHQNFNKRVVKMPKLYFCDTGIATSLLGIHLATQLDLHPFKGALFENLIIADFLKRRFNQAKPSNLFFWRDNVGNEVDLLMDNGTHLNAIEIKSGQTITNDYFKGLVLWNKITKQEGGTVIYGGNEIQKRSNQMQVIPYLQMQEITV